jgi:hypothetical protein
MGGALYANRSRVSISDSDISSNSSSGEGAIDGGGTSLTVRDSRFVGNDGA